MPIVAGRGRWAKATRKLELEGDTFMRRPRLQRGIQDQLSIPLMLSACLLVCMTTPFVHLECELATQFSYQKTLDIARMTIKMADILALAPCMRRSISTERSSLSCGVSLW